MMLCKIADFITEVQEVGGITPYLRDYQYDGHAETEIIITDELFEKSNYYFPEADLEFQKYLYLGNLFFSRILASGGLYLHASAVAYQEKAYLFSADSGTGKSTHTRLWKQIFGDQATVFNDDKPILRKLDGTWYAYGTPWCGKDFINANMKVPVAGICFLKQAGENKIRRIDKSDAALRIFEQSIRYMHSSERLDLLLPLIDRVVRDIPVFELENRPEPEAALLSYETMRKAAEEMGL